MHSASGFCQDLPVAGASMRVSEATQPFDQSVHIQHGDGMSEMLVFCFCSVVLLSAFLAGHEGDHG